MAAASGVRTHETRGRRECGKVPGGGVIGLARMTERRTAREVTEGKHEVEESDKLRNKETMRHRKTGIFMP